MTENLELENAKLKLKVQALNERLAEVTTDSENRIADLRVDLTLMSQQGDQLREQLRQLQQGQDDFNYPDDAPEVLDGELVDG